VSGSSPGPRQYRALAHIAAKRRRAGYRAAKARDQVTAIGEYRAALDLIRELAAIEPADHDLLRQLAGECHQEGNFAAVMGYAVAVRYEFRAELLLLERLSQDLPEDLGLLRARADAHHELARRAQFDGDQEAARREQQAEVALLRQLAMADPEIGDLLREAMGGDGTEGSAGALGEPGPADAELGPFGGLTGTGPGELPADAEDRIRNLTGLAERARAVGDGETLRSSLQALVMLRERMAAARPGDMTAQLDLAGAYRELGDCYAGFGQDDAAYESSQAGVAVLVLLAAAGPSDADRLNALAGAYGLLADRARSAGYPVPARAAVQAEVLIRSWLVTFQPVSWRQQALDEAQRRLASLPSADPPPGGLLSR
jgi:tetratricopeptide (TPR) repeat protein